MKAKNLKAGDKFKINHDIEDEICYYDDHDWLYDSTDEDYIEEVIIYHTDLDDDLILGADCKVTLIKPEKPKLNKKLVAVSLITFIASLSILQVFSRE